MSYVISLFHIVISTHERRLALPAPGDSQLYKYIVGVVRNHNSQVLAINGIEDHIHILVDVNVTESLAAIVRDIKRSSSMWLAAKCDEFPLFRSWSRGYYAVSISVTHKDAVIRYIASQKEHHKTTSSDEEFSQLLDKLKI